MRSSRSSWPRLIPSVARLCLPKLKSIGIVEGNELIAGLIYYNWNPDAGFIEISCAALPGRNWLTRETIKRSYQYPFLTCGCQMLFAIVAEDNETDAGGSGRAQLMRSSACRG